MLLIDVIEQMTRSQRMLCAHRWGVDSATPMVIAERLLVDESAARLVRRMAKAGAPNLARLLVESVGVGIAEQASLAAEAAVVRDWGVLLEEDGRWSLPVDLAIAARGEAKNEGWLLGSLIARLSPKALRALADEVDVHLAGSHVSQCVRVRQGVLAGFAVDAADAPLREGVDALAAMTSVASNDVQALTPVEGRRGQLFDVTLKNGTQRRIAPRELALALGRALVEIAVQGAPLTPLTFDRVQALPVVPVGGVITFQSEALCARAMHSKWLKDQALEVIGARVLLRPGVVLRAVRDELLRLGYESASDGEFHAG